MVVTIRRLTPLATVASVPRSIAFYEQLGFTLGNTFSASSAEEPTWAWLECGDVSLMVATNSKSVSNSTHTVLFYLYVDDVNAMHTELALKGMHIGAIATPFYAPGGEFELIDPDGYLLVITHV
jgi:predicted enzyme related to lactoylglutathione lyase